MLTNDIGGNEIISDIVLNEVQLPILELTSCQPYLLIHQIYFRARLDFRLQGLYK